MKIRSDFVTNSSSSSFIISKHSLSQKQINAIFHHSELGERLGMYNSECKWNICESEHYISGSTSMDNFNMEEFLDTIGVSNKSIDWRCSESCYLVSLYEDEYCLTNESNNLDWETMLNEIMEDD